MKEFFTILTYTFKENSRKKTFIISTIITLLLTIIIISLPAIMNKLDNHEKNKTEQGTNQTKNQEPKGVVFVVDSKDILKGDLNKLGNVFLGYEFKAEAINNIDLLKNKVKEEDKSALLILDENNGVPKFDYFVKQSGNGINPTEISGVIKSAFVTDLLTNAKVPDKISALVQTNISFNVTELGKGKMNSYISSLVISMLLFFSIYFYGYGVALSVSSEKSSRVIELLVTSTKPSIIILGKTAAMGILGLIQLFMVVLTGVLTYKLTFPENFKIAGQVLNFSNFTPFSIVMIILYFILGYSLYAMMNAVAGATVSKAEDVNSTIMPISMISMVAFYMGYFSLAVPSGNVAILSSIIPFSSPFSMPCRVLATEVPAWQIVASIFSLVITIVIIAWISIKIYSNATLHYGKRLKLRDLMQMSSKNK